MNFTVGNKKIISIGAACFIVVLAAFLIYWFALRDDNHFPEFDDVYDNGNEISVVSVSPQGLSGVAQNEPLVIQWNRPVTAEAAEAVEITPKTKGNWTAVGDKLIFHPQRWQSGTYYKVSIAQDTEIPGSGSVIQKNVAFSFETQDSTLRIPSTSALYLESQQFFFQDEEEIVIPLAYYDANGAVPDVTAKLWSCPDSKTFIETFLPLFSLPQWANLSASRFQGETSGLKRLNKVDYSLENGALHLKNPGKGQYLLRLTVGGISRDVAVTVSDIQSYTYYDGNHLLYWGLDRGKPLKNATLVWGFSSMDIDANGCAFMQSNDTLDDRLLSPQKNVVRVSWGEQEQIIFLSADENGTSAYDGEITVSNHLVGNGDDLTFFGYVKTSLPSLDISEDVTISVENQSGIVKTFDASLDEQGCFSVKWERLSLPQGQWKAVINVGQNPIASYNFTVRDEISDKPCLWVTMDASSYEKGEDITFTVQALDQKGKPMEGLSITASGDVGKRITDDNGEAVFYFHAMDLGILPVIDQRVVFSATLSDGTELETECRYSIVNSEQENGSSPESDHSMAVSLENSEAVVYGSLRDGVLETSPEFTKNYDFALAYDGDDIAMIPKIVDSPQLNLPEEITIEAGESLKLSPDDSSHSYFAALYDGNPAGSALGKGVSCDSIGDAMTMGFLAMDMVADGNSTLSLTAPSIPGSYFLRVYGVQPYYGGTYWDIPVTVTNGVRLWSDGKTHYSSDSAVNLSYHTIGDVDSYRLSLSNDAVWEGEASEDFTVSLGKMAAGTYSGTLTLVQEGREVLHREVSFSVGKNEPLLKVTEEKSKDDRVWQSYNVSQEIMSYAEKLFQLNLLHGDQLLQVMARNDFYTALGENAGNLVVYRDNNLLKYQNNDGSFGRLPGLKGDLLLSAIVTDNNNAVFNHEALLSYAQERSLKSDDAEILALGLWIMSSLQEPPLDDMKALLQSKDLTDLAVLYLAKAFQAADEGDIAKSLYRELKESLNQDGDSSYFPDNDGQMAIMKTLFMLDLSLSFGGKDAEPYMNYLMNVDMTTQTNRYLMSQCLLRWIQIDEIKLAEHGNLYLVADEPKTEEVLPASFLMDDKTITRCEVGDTVTLDVQWSGLYKTNNLYLVYISPDNGVEVLLDEQISLGHGYVTAITENSSAQIRFTVNQPSDGVLGTVYVYDLTAGVLLGKVESKGLMVENER
ncbi:MAG: hypothetical protein U0M15_02080 [Bacillota bacterium]|nr:hypothetical protein [Bacillota bacterium]